MRNDIICLVGDHARDLARLDALFNHHPIPIAIVSPNIPTTETTMRPIMNFEIVAQNLEPIVMISDDNCPGPRNRAKRLKARDQRKKMKKHHKRRG